MKTVAFTGHRTERFHFGENDEEFKRLKIILFKIIKRLYEYGYVNFISGMAIGFDTWAAEAVCELKEQIEEINLICAIPFEKQDSSWSEKDKSRRKSLINKASSVVMVSEKYFSGCYHKRNRYMIDHSEVLVCFYDGISSGGTAYTVKYGLQKGKIVIRIDPKTFKVEIISHENFK